MLSSPLTKPRTAALAVLAAPAAMLALAPTALAHVSNRPQMISWQANGRVSAMAVVGNTAYLGGSFTAMISPAGTRSVSRSGLAAVNVRTGKLLSWHPTANGAVLAIKPDGGRVLVGGTFTRVDGRPRGNVASVSASRGTLTPGWNASADASVEAIAFNSSRIFLGGAFTRVDRGARGHLAAVSAESGAIVRAWHPSVNAAVHALSIDTGSGVLYAGGDFTTANGRAGAYLQPFSTGSGTLERWAGHPVARVWSIVYGGGRVYAGVGGTGGQVDAFLQTTGAASWQRWADGDVQAVTYSDGTVLAGGHFANACLTGAGGGTPWVCAQPVARARLMSLDAVSGALQAWNPGADSEWGVFALKQSATRVFAGGDFKHIGGVHRWHYAQFLR